MVRPLSQDSLQKKGPSHSKILRYKIYAQLAALEEAERAGVEWVQAVRSSSIKLQ